MLSPATRKTYKNEQQEAAAAVLLDTRYRERGGVGCCHLLLLLPLLPCRPRWRQVRKEACAHTPTQGVLLREFYVQYSVFSGRGVGDVRCHPAQRKKYTTKTMAVKKLVHLR